MDQEKYHHPFKPYGIQKNFMDALYDTLESKKVGIFESPTGTGKTLSLICPALTWLRNAEDRGLQAELQDLEKSAGPRWTIDAAKQVRIDQHKERGQVLHDLIEKAKEKQKARSVRVSSQQRHPKIPKASVGSTNDLGGSADYMLDDPVIDAETKDLIDSFGVSDDGLEALHAPQKIYFTSRTHSQLSQLVGALKLFKIPASWSDSPFELVKHVSLGSRKQLCIHPEVSRLKSTQQINDKCMDMQNSSKKCEFKKGSDNGNVQEFREEILTEILDIEELHKLGQELKVCPYYASRELLPFCEVVTMPYQLLFQHSARQALNIDLKDSIIIIDEAHNLLDVVSSLYSASVTHRQVSAALSGLEIYYKRVGSRLSSINRARVSQAIKVVSSLEKFLEASAKLPPKSAAPGTKIKRSDLFAANNADMINLYELQEFLTTSKLAFKVDSYLKQDKNIEHPNDSLVLGRVIEFLLLATDPLSDGKLFYDRNESQEISVNYLLLDPSHQFEDVVKEAKCVILAGGTMEPTSDYLTHLFPYLDKEQINLFSCGHIVPDANLMVEPVSRGPHNLEFEFTFAKRNDPKMIMELGETLLQISRSVIAGLVVFFPSYAYLNHVTSLWKKQQIYGKLNAIKEIFHEDKSLSADEILGKYSKKIHSHGAAMMFAVVGGKLSEGINFSDDLARGVVMIGLPFPNAFSAELVAKREHIESVAKTAGKTAQEAQQLAREYYENLSMRAVNQSIGRAIRHVGDYAAIFLIDRRYNLPNIQNKLSGWIRDSLMLEASLTGRPSNHERQLAESITRTSKFFVKTRKVETKH